MKYQNNFYGEQDMVKKTVKWVVIVVVRMAEWFLWPVAKAHSWLRKFADKLCDRTSFL
tara:strand:+ start:193 stop:366 length:174 start_codon:yes stop_codon:yes gene_type:complete